MKKRRRQRVVFYKNKRFLIYSLLSLFLFLGMGYSTLSTDLDISGDITVKEYASPTLYNVFKKAAKVGTYAREYEGSHQDSIDVSQTNKKIYHWYAGNNTNGTAILDMNNVIFANHCWQMLRTTDTGGVKMIYNGEVDDGKCLNTRGTHVGYYGTVTQTLNSNYWYGTDYIYDKTNDVFSISGTTEQVTWNDTTAPGLIGKYTCKSTAENGTCATLYLIESYSSSSKANVIELSKGYHYSQFGRLIFNPNLEVETVSYMYNTPYSFLSADMTESEAVLSDYLLGTNYWYAHSATWGSPTANKYNLDNPYKISSTSDYPNLVGEYTFRNTNQTYTNTKVYYIVGVQGSYMYYIPLTDDGNHTLADYNYTYTYGDSFTDNGNGTYTINNPTTINRSDWFVSYNTMVNKYVCKNATNNTCSDLRYVTSTDDVWMNYIEVANSYKYAKGFTYDENTGIYTLNSNSVSFWNITDSTNVTSLNNAHYTCWNTTGECSTISYIYYVGGSEVYYVYLTDGKDVETALTEMLQGNNVNQYSSIIKKGLDAWYEHYLLEDYDDYIEDTIFCNDRSIRSLGGWDSNGGNITEYLKFNGFLLSRDLSCPNITDRFSVSNSSAQLTYPIGLATGPEMNILGNNNVRKTGQEYWLMSPYLYYYGGLAAAIQGIGTSGGITNLTFPSGVRPVISLKPDTEYASGDGSMANPYVVE